MAPRSAHDQALRGKLQHDRKRELDQKHKWSLGEAACTPGRSKKQPAKPPRSAFARALYNSKTAQVSRKRGSAHIKGPLLSDSSIEEDIQNAHAEPEPDAGVTYSFDAPRGPNQGGQILGMALAKAVEKYEIQATENLIKAEYEVVAKEKEDASTSCASDDSDFEFV
ncbi:MAG: hypothetical protein Q9219_000577 [cf. Caloplaca sp. 3 TL-2023]